MFQDLLKNQLVIITLFGGTALVLYFMIYYIDLWRPRKKKEEKLDEYETNYLSANEAIPWAIKIIILVVVVFMIYYTIFGINNPQNW